MEAVGLLAGGVAHEFNNMLQIVRGYTELALSAAGFPEKYARHLDKVLKAAEGASNLTRQLLTFSRRQVLQPRPLDVNALISNLGKMLQRLIGEHIELLVRPGQIRAKVFVDAGLLELVLFNLCINARDAMPGGGRLTIHTQLQTLGEGSIKAYGIADPGPYVQIVVSDTGVGMTAEVIQHIFEPFFTTKEAGRGTGLGLSMAYGIIQQHKGVIEVESAPGRGATFRILLPTTTHDEPAPTPAEAPATPGGHETVLIAEDDGDVLGLVVQLLESQGYRVLTASDGLEAVAVFNAHREQITLVILDMVMPRLGGRAAYEQIKRLRPEVAVMFSTGYAASAQDADFLARSGSRVLKKPYSPSELFLAVREAADTLGTA
jgi:CheY-like chemotaxis protein